MNINQFMLCIEELRQCFGDKSYPDIRVKKMFETLKEITYTDFRDAVNDFIRGSKWPPLQADFEIKLKVQLDNIKKNSKIKQLERIGNCSRCNNSGMYMIKEPLKVFTGDKELTGNFTYRCSCGWAEALGLSNQIKRQKTSRQLQENTVPNMRSTTKRSGSYKNLRGDFKGLQGELSSIVQNTSQ